MAAVSPAGPPPMITRSFCCGSPDSWVEAVWGSLSVTIDSTNQGSGWRPAPVKMPLMVVWGTAVDPRLSARSWFS